MKLSKTPCQNCGHDEFATHDYPVIYCMYCERSWTEKELKEVEVTLYYQDGSNYKCTWDTWVSVEALSRLFGGEKIHEGSYLDGLYSKFLGEETDFEIDSLGLEVSDIPLIKEYGYDQETDHNLISILKIKF